MNRRAFLSLLGFGAAAAAAPAIACEILKAPAAVEVGRYEGVRFIETEDVTIGDAFIVSDVSGSALDACMAQVRNVAMHIAGHDRIEMIHLPRAFADKSDPLNQNGYIGWKAHDPLVGWRDRYTDGNALFDAELLVRSTA